mgnify:CR=1 FL=1
MSSTSGSKQVPRASRHATAARHFDPRSSTRLSSVPNPLVALDRLLFEAILSSVVDNEKLLRTTLGCLEALCKCVDLESRGEDRGACARIRVKFACQTTRFQSPTLAAEATFPSPASPLHQRYRPRRRPRQAQQHICPIRRCPRRIWARMKSVSPQPT